MEVARPRVPTPEEVDGPDAGTRPYDPIFKLALLTLAATFVLIVIGGVVRTSGSGLACPDWPLCQGRVVPPSEPGTAIEFAHRLTAMAVGILTLGMGLFAVRLRRSDPTLFIMVLLGGILVLAQILLGAAVIVTRLPPVLVTAHLAMATAFAGTLAVVAASAYRSPRPGHSNPSSAAPTVYLVLASAVATYVLIVVGAYVGSSGSSLACTGWPLCGDSLIPKGDWREWLGFSHRLLALLALLAMLAAAVSARRSGAPRRIRVLLNGAAALMVVEIAVGALNPILRVPAPVAVAHLALATLIWLQLVGAAAFALEGNRSPRNAPATP